MTGREVFELFPTPVMRVAGLLAASDARALAGRLQRTVSVDNPRSDRIAHSRLLGPGEDPLLDRLVEQLGPHVQALGEHLFGEPLRWLVKEIWVNTMATGGHQALHNHANSFVSGVVYLTPCDDSARTAFVRDLGGRDFVFRNQHDRLTPGRFSAQTWVAPAPQPGDLLLFPSYLLHEVPLNRGGPRVTLAFNAIPHRLDAWGYATAFGPA